MRRESHEPTISHSSIILLQERFKQLQRVKEMREERELMRMVSEPYNNNYYHKADQLNLFNPNMQYYDPGARLFFHSDLVLLPQRSSPPQASLSLWPSLQNHSDCSFETFPLLMKLWPTETTPSSTEDSELFDRRDDDYSDVDTSLHL